MTDRAHLSAFSRFKVARGKRPSQAATDVPSSIDSFHFSRIALNSKPAIQLQATHVCERPVPLVGVL